MDLGLASKSAEGSGKDDAVVVLVKRAATEFIGAVHGFPKPFTGEQGVPVQDYLHIAFSRPLKNVGEAASARQKQAKKRSLGCSK